MRLTPLDIRKQEFKKGMRGLDTDEVHAFLATVADEYEAVLNDNKALRERLIELDDKVAEYRNMEKTLRDTLLTAERVTVEAKDNAQREANLVIKEAQIEADKSVREIKREAMDLRHEIQNLKRQRDSYLARMKMLVESHMKFLETAETDFANEDKQLEREIKKWADEEATAPKPAPATKPNEPSSASARAAAPAAPQAQPAPAVKPPTPAAGTPPERGELPPTTASAPTPAAGTSPERGELPPSKASAPAPVESTSAPQAPRAGTEVPGSVSIQGQSGASREQEIRRLLDRMTNEHEPNLEQTPGGTSVATLTETAEEAKTEARTEAKTEARTEAKTDTDASSEEEPNKWSLDRLRQDILSRSSGNDEKN